MATKVLGLKTFAASDPVDYNEINDNYNKIDNGVKTALQGRAAHNLLDNSDFRNPVNQRGGTTYSGSKTYTIDRWLIASGGNVEVNSGYITLKNPTTTGRKAFEQLLPKNHIGKTLTVACCIHSTGKVYCASAVVPSVSNSAQYFCQADFDGHSVRLGLSASGVLSVQIMIANDSNVSIRWAALYEGSYTADTLPAYQPKGYAAELAECQLYYRRGVQAATIGKLYTAGSIFSIHFPKMRIDNPTINLIDIISQGWGNVDKNNYSAAWGDSTGGENYMNFLSSVTDDIGKTIVVFYESCADL